MPSDNFLWFPKPATGGLLTGASPQPAGETSDGFFGKKTPCALEIQSFSFGIEQAETTGSAASGAGAGKAKFNEFVVKKLVDQASCALFQACAAGAHFPQVYLAIRKAGGSPLIYLEYIFSMVYVTSVSWDGGSGDEAPTEEDHFKYGALGVQYQRQGTDGQAMGGPSTAAWSVVMNAPSMITKAGDTAPAFDPPGSSLPS
jgi:type VI secretion system secreted protein Hcp